MMTNGLLISFFFRPIGIPFWRQIIWLLGIIIFYRVLIKDRQVKYRYYKIDKYIKITNILVFCFVLVAIFFVYYSPLRVLFSGIQYVFGFSFLAMPYVFTKSKNVYVLFKYFAFLGFFISVGLIIDSITPIFELVKVKENPAERATFFSENSTTLGISYNFLLISVFYCFYCSKNILSKLVFFLVPFLLLAGAWTTGSRQVFFILILTFILSYSYLLLKSTKNRAFMIIVSIVVCVCFFNNAMNFFEQSSQKSRFNQSALEEDVRYKSWIEGAKHFLPDNFEYWIIGRGISSTNGKGDMRGEKFYPHYENTFIARFVDAGYLGLFIYLLPIFYALKLILKNKFTFFSLLMTSFIIGYLFVSFISPNGGHPLSSITLFIVIGLLLNRDKFDIDFHDSLKI
jgi:hypothetical protein